MPKVTNELSATTGVSQNVQFRLRGDTVQVDFKDNHTVAEEAQSPYSFPITCPSGAKIMASMRVVIVNVEMPWQAEEIVSWPIFDIVTASKTSGVYHGVLHSQVIVSMHTNKDTSAGDLANI